MSDWTYDNLLKTRPGPFRAIWRKQKTAEFRRDDWEAQVGDRVLLIEHDGACWIQPYRQVLIEVTHRQDGFGIPVGYVMLSFREIRRKVGPRGIHKSHERCGGC